MSIIYAYRLEHPSNGKGPWNFATMEDKKDGEVFIGDLRIQLCWSNGAYINYTQLGFAFELARCRRLPVHRFPGFVTGFDSLDELINYFFSHKDFDKLFGRAGFVIRKYQVNGRLKIHEQSHQIAFDKKASSVIEECPV